MPFSRESDPLVLVVYLNWEYLPIGYAVLKGFNMELLTTEISIEILDQKYRKKGYAKLALKRLSNYGFEKSNIQTIAAKILSSNKSSINIYKNLVFVVRFF